MRISTVIIRRADEDLRRLGVHNLRCFRSYRARFPTGKARMSIRLMARIWEELFNLRGTKLLVALALADWGRDDGSKIFPSMETIARKCRISVREARRIVSEFERSGLLVREKSGVGRGKNAEWRMVLASAENRTETSGFEVEKTGQKQHENRTNGALKTGQNGSNPGVATTYNPSLNQKKSSAVDKSTSPRGRKCTHGKCAGGPCTYPGGADVRTLARVDFNRELEQLEVRAAMAGSAKSREETA